MVSVKHALSNWLLGSVSQKSQKAIHQTTCCSFYKAVFFSEVVKGIKIKITAKLSSSRHLPFEDIKIIMLPEVRPKSFGAF